jgi:hypothetical protein
MAGLLVEGNKRLLTVYRDELSGLILSMNRYHHAGGDRQFYLEGYSGVRGYTVDRVTRPSVWVPDLLFSVLGGIQPKVANQVLLSGEKDGLVARLFCVWPELGPWKAVDQQPRKTARDALRGACDRPAGADWSRLLLKSACLSSAPLQTS